MLLCMICNSSLLLDNQLVNEPKSVGFYISQIIYKLFGKISVFLSCTKRTTPNDILLSFTQIKGHATAAPISMSTDTGLRRVTDPPELGTGNIRASDKPPSTKSVRISEGKASNSSRISDKGSSSRDKAGGSSSRASDKASSSSRTSDKAIVQYSSLLSSSHLSPVILIIENPQLVPEATQEFLCEVLETNTVIAITSKKTSSLPLKLMDKFLLRIPLEAPFNVTPSFKKVKPVHSTEEIEYLRAAHGAIFVQHDIQQYMRDIVVALRTHQGVEWGVSEVCYTQLEIAARACAVLFMQKYVTPTHVMLITTRVLNHKFKCTKQIKNTKKYNFSMYFARDILIDIFEKLPVPL